MTAKPESISTKSSMWVVAAIFLALPFALISPGLIWKSQQVFFVMSGLIIVASTIKNRWVRGFLVYLFIWQLFLCVSRLRGSAVNPIAGMEMTVTLTIAALIYQKVSDYSCLSTDTWYSIIRIAVLVQIIIASLQYFGFFPVTSIMQMFIPITDVTNAQLTGMLGNRNFLASFIAMSIPMFIGWRTMVLTYRPHGEYPKNININLSLIVIFVLLLLMPSAATLAAIIGLGIYSKSYKNILAGILMAFAYGYWHVAIQGNHLIEFQLLWGQLNQFYVTGRFTPESNLLDIGRFAMWLTAISKAIETWPSFIFGSGPGAFWGRPYNMHNEYVQTFFEFGLIGLVLMIGYLRQSFKMLLAKKDAVLFTSLAILCLDMAGNHSFHVASTGFMALIVCGLIERVR